MKKLTVFGAILAICLFASVALADNRPEVNITLSGGAVNYYNDNLGSTQVGMELALPAYHELYVMAEGSGSFFFIPLLNARLVAGPRIQTKDGLVANFGALYQYAQGLDRERPDGNFWGGHVSLLLPITDNPHGIKIGTSVDYAVNPKNDASLLFVGLKISLPIDLTRQDNGNFRARDIFNRR